MRLLILAGFLGSGKTTLLGALAETFTPEQRAKLVIVENEAGSRGVDDQVLAAGGLQVRQVYGGCICCTLRVNLQRTLVEVAEALEPELVVVEPSGVADPSEVVELARASTLPLERIDLVVLIDALRWDKLRQVAGPFLERGIIAADIVALNKVDLIDTAEADRLVGELETIRGRAVRRLSAATGEGLAALWSAIDLAREPGRRPAGEAPKLDHATLSADWNLAFEPPIDAGQLVRRLRSAHQRLAARLRGEGHLKSLVRVGAQQVVCRSVAWDQPPQIDGRLEGEVVAAQVTVHAVVIGQPSLDAAWIAGWPEALGGRPVS